MPGASAFVDRRVKIGVRRFIDGLRDQRELILKELEMPDATEPLRMVAHVRSLDARISMVVAAARPIVTPPAGDAA